MVVFAYYKFFPLREQSIMENFPNLILEILSDSSEDYIGLYEVVWRINTLYPEPTQQEREMAARYAVATLLSREWIEVFRTRDYFSKEKPVEFVRVDGAETEKVLTDPVSWEPFEKGKDPWYWIAATEKGEDAYNALWPR